MSVHQVSRRTLARGAAWSVPIVAVGVAAPAFAVSPGSTPHLVPGGSCKCPGSGGNNFNFKAVIAVATAGNADWTFTITGFTFDGVASTNPAPITLTGGDGNLILMKNLTNSAAKHFVAFNWSAKNGTTGEVVTGSFPSTQLTFAPNCVSPILCP